MAALRTIESNGRVRYHSADAYGNHLTLQLSPTGALMIGTEIEFSVVLSQANAVDLLAAFTGFANTGAIP